jgi:uncharacterized membrane protein (DUF4010 family)
MLQAPSLESAALLLGLSFFLGLAFEDFFNRGNTRRPGGIRTFPMLAMGGGALYLFDPVHFIPFTGGLLVLGSWLFIYYQKHAGEPDEEGESNVGLVVPVLNVHAYVLGAITLALPHWVAVATTVIGVMLLTGRTQLHDLARRVELREIITAAQFLILTGIVLPLLPNEPVTALTKITPRQVWLALVVVCTFSYVSYLAQRYWAAAARGLWMAALGGLYSSTAATVVLARQAKADPTLQRQARAGITLATGIMYLRIAAITAIFDVTLARILAPPLIGLALAGFVICAAQYWWGRPSGESKQEAAILPAARGNPLEIIPAAVFAGLFVATSLASSFAIKEFGTSGIYALAAIIGVSDIDPFVLNLVQGGTTGVTNMAIAAAILIAASSNNMLKAFYAISFGGRITAASAAALIVLAIAGAAIAIFMAMGWF